MRELATKILEECADLYREPQHREWAISRAIELLRGMLKPAQVESCPQCQGTLPPHRGYGACHCFNR